MSDGFSPRCTCYFVFLCTISKLATWHSFLIEAWLHVQERVFSDSKPHRHDQGYPRTCFFGFRCCSA
ncbi:hypothetical protein L596_006805 [Steinernema carpocapsae]|uniref:Uncharacterized protein n=1 Tax=Steinernema carpocapsae TaxID=34508 RepID=A0A4U5P6X5_STECR|nr:hypothetical protein L596_006805 [Steinernema carpocapsae]